MRHFSTKTTLQLKFSEVANTTNSNKKWAVGWLGAVDVDEIVSKTSKIVLLQLARTNIRTIPLLSYVISKKHFLPYTSTKLTLYADFTFTSQRKRVRNVLRDPRKKFVDCFVGRGNNKPSLRYRRTKYPTTPFSSQNVIDETIRTGLWSTRWLANHCEYLIWR